MTELSFAKSFLATLDSRPIKLQSDYAADPKTFEPKGPVMPFSIPPSHYTPPTLTSLTISIPSPGPPNPCAVATPLLNTISLTAP